VDHGQNPESALLLTTEVETLTPSWAIFDAPTHLTSVLAWEKWAISYQISYIWISPFVYNFVGFVSSVISLLIEDQYYLSLQYPHVFSTSSIESLFPHHHQTKTSKLLF
jgi:hypothetical protein